MTKQYALLFAGTLLTALATEQSSYTPSHSAETTQVSAGTSSEVLKAVDVERLKAAVGREVVVEGTIQTAEWSGSGAVMNIQFEGAPGGLLAVIFQRDAPNLSRALGGDLERILPGKTVQVRGRLGTYGGQSLRFTDRPQIIIRDATQIAIPKDGRSESNEARESAAAATSSEVLKAADVERLKAAIGREVVVEGTIQTAEWSGSGAVMNIQFEGAPGGLLAVIFQRDAPNLSRALGGDLERILPGKTVQVRGQLETYGGQSPRFTNRPQIIIRKATQIEMRRKTGSP